MSVCYNGVVATPAKDVFLVCSLVEHALNGLIVKERKAKYPTRHWFDLPSEYRTCSIDLCVNSKLASVRFTFRGERRTMSVFFDCDGDHKALAQKSIAVSIGTGGHAELYTKVVMHALSLLGPAYIGNEAIDDGKLSELGFYRPTAMSLIALGLYPAHGIEYLVSAYDAGLMAIHRTFKEVMGVEESWLRAKLLESDKREAWDAVKAHALSVSHPAVRFENDEPAGQLTV